MVLKFHKNTIAKYILKYFSLKSVFLFFLINFIVFAFIVYISVRIETIFTYDFVNWKDYMERQTYSLQICLS